MSSLRLCVVASATAPLSVLLPAYDLATAIRGSKLPVTGGYHTSLERECLEIFLRGQQPISICPAREFAEGHRLYSGKLWAEVKRGITEGRVRIQPPPGVKGARITRENAEIRNAYLLEIADRLLVLSSNEGSHTAAMAHTALERGMPVFVMDHPSNRHLLDAGAKVVTIEALTATE